MDAAISREKNKTRVAKEHLREEAEAEFSFSYFISRLCEMSLDSLLKQARGSYTHLMPLAASLGLCFPPTTRAGTTPQWKHSSRPQASGMPNCQSQHQPAAATSLLFTSLAPVHPGCPLLAPTWTREGRHSLVHSLPRYFQGHCWVPDSARSPVARLRPITYSGEQLLSWGPAVVCPTLLSWLLSRSPS